MLELSAHGLTDAELAQLPASAVFGNDPASPNALAEVQRLRSDSRAIESAARSRLNMVRPNEIVIPVD